MDCIIITIGNEILSGRTIDSNSAYISNRLSSIGIYTKTIITIADDKDEIEKVVRDALIEADLVITSGGLGPTRDDITKKTIAKIFDRELILDGDILRSVEDRFKKFGYKKLPESNLSQAEIPEGSYAFPNKRGTAPGILIKDENKICVLVPGVPFEMEGLIDQFIIPYLEQNVENGQYIISRTIRTTGIGESSLSEILEPHLADSTDVEIAYLPGYTGVDLRLTAMGNDKKSLEKSIKKVEKTIKGKAAKFIYGYDNNDLAQIAFKLLKKKGLTLAVAESCTGGLICHRLTNIPGSSSIFSNGAVTYSDQAKKDVLKIPGKILKKSGAVSSEAALCMAEQVRLLFKADIGISTTGIAGPDRDKFKNPVGLVFIGYSDKHGSDYKELRLGEGRIKVKERAAQAALNLLRIKLND